MVAANSHHERRERLRSPKGGRHRGEGGSQRFSSGFSALATLALEGSKVSASVIDLSSGKVLVSIDDTVVLPIASLGTVLLLVEVSARITADTSNALSILEKPGGPGAVADAEMSGIWNQLHVPALPVSDLAALVGATNDSVATNVLLGQIGLDSVRARTDSLGLSRTALIDKVRTTRGPDDAPQVSVGATAELTRLIASLARGEVVDAITSRRVLGWLEKNADLSLVASAFGLTPLSRIGDDQGVQLVNKTGSDRGVRAEVGVVRGTRAAVCYALTVNFTDSSLAARLRVLEAMRVFGHDVLDYVH